MVRYQKFDWFTLNRDNLFDVLYTARASIVGQNLTIPQIHDRLAKTIRNFLPVRVKKEIDAKVLPGWIYIGGAYHSDDDQEGRKCVTINFAYNSKDQFIKVSGRRFSRMCVGFADTVLHEIIHMRQYRRRNWRVIPDYPSTAKRTAQREEQSYLGCRDEIDAYAFNIACELMDRFDFSEKKVFQYINENRIGTGRKHNSYKMYLKAFSYDHRHPVIKRLKKKVVSYLPQARSGKPYRNSEWINY